MSGLIAREQPEQRERCKGGAESRTGGGEGFPGCTSEALGARKLGRGRVERRRVSLMERGIHPRLSRQGDAGGDSCRYSDRAYAEPGVTRSAWMPRRPDWVEEGRSLNVRNKAGREGRTARVSGTDN